MTPGAQFDPQDVTRRLRTYPVDIIDARLDISDGPKRLYAKLFRIAMTADRRKNPWLGYVYASEKYLSGQLGKSISGIRRDSVELRLHGLVRVERPNRTANNQYYFVWDPAFDRANVSGRDSSDVSAQECADSSHLSGHDSADVSGLYKEYPRVLTHTERASEIGRTEIDESTGARPLPAQGKGARGNGSASATPIRRRRTAPAAASRPMWPAGGWLSQEDFDAWWNELVRRHPNRNRNAAAKALALELIRDGQLECEAFDQGYETLQAVNRQRWADQGGRFAPNLQRIFEDAAWKLASDRVPPATDYQDAETYLQRVVNE